MSKDMLIAKDMLLHNDYTCVLCNDESIYTTRDRGVKPLLQWLDEGIDLTKYTAADKVVGKAAAFLYVMLGVRYVYATVVSEPAIEVFSDYHIDFKCDVIVRAIRNRENTGYCPMETAVYNISDKDEALVAIRNKLSQLNGKGAV